MPLVPRLDLPLAQQFLHLGNRSRFWVSITSLPLKATIGNAAFASEKQGDPVNPEQCEWDASYFDYPGFCFEQWPQQSLS